jgi:hypothetical protein
MIFLSICPNTNLQRGSLYMEKTLVKGRIVNVSNIGEFCRFVCTIDLLSLFIFACNSVFFCHTTRI